MVSGSPRVLIVDDDASITYALKLGLERNGFLADVYNDPRDMLDRVDANAYQVAIFDFKMPKMNGLELYREFRKLNGKTPICIFTALDLSDEEVFLIVFGGRMQTLIKKPISIVGLVAILERILAPTR